VGRGEDGVGGGGGRGGLVTTAHSSDRRHCCPSWLQIGVFGGDGVDFGGGGGGGDGVMRPSCAAGRA
jgi:hypothetical protein